MKVFKSIVLLIILLFVLEFSVNSLQKIGVLKKADDQKVEVEEAMNEYYFICSDFTEGAIIYDEPSQQAALILGEELIILDRAISASGSKYENLDQGLVFWEKGGQASIEINGEIVHSECELGLIEQSD